MQQESLYTLRCPACYGTFELSQAQEQDDIIIHGQLTCRQCAQEYLIRDRIAFLGFIDRSWSPTLKEIIARRKLTLKNLLQQEEADLQQLHVEQNNAAIDVQERAFQLALQRMGKLTGKKIIEIGAYTCDNALRMAEAGADVIAVEPDYIYLIDSPHTNYSPRLQKVAADGHRLPFTNATFDIATCRATLHHVKKPEWIMREMGRVLKPGGSLVVMSEPFRPFYYPEIYCIRGLIDYQSGLNESTHVMTKYWKGLKAGDFRESKIVLLQEMEINWPKRLYPLRFFWAFIRRFMKIAEDTIDAKSVKLLFNGGGINIYAMKGNQQIRKPASLNRDQELITMQELLKLDAYQSQLDAIQNTERRIEKLETVYRKSLQPKYFSRSIDFSCKNQKGLVKGWRPPDQHGKGYISYTHRFAECLLNNQKRHQKIQFEVFGFPETLQMRHLGNVYHDNRLLGELHLTKDDWHIIEFDLPETVGEIVLITIENLHMLVPDEVFHNGDRREIGLGFRRIRLV